MTAIGHCIEGRFYSSRLGVSEVHEAFVVASHLCTEYLWLQGMADRLVEPQGPADWVQDEGRIMHRCDSCPALGCFRQ